MGEFARQFGIDWKLLVSQAVNFFVLLVVLRVFVYKPVLHILYERKKKIEEGMAKAVEADQRLAEVQITVHSKLEEADTKGLAVIRAAEGRAKKEEERLLAEAARKVDTVMRDARLAAEAERIRVQEEVSKEAQVLVRSAMQKIVELKPEDIDEALISRAIAAAKEPL